MSGSSPFPSPVQEIELRLPGSHTTQEFGAALAGCLRPGDLITLTGDLGAGKTTFTQGLGRGLAVRDGIISPTFVLARMHPSCGDGPGLVHVDAYRLQSRAEFLGLDLEAYVSTSVTVVEWGRGMAEGLVGFPEDPLASWLDVTLVRPVGGEHRVTSRIITDFSDEDGEGGDEIRSAVVRAYGPRWVGIDLSVVR